MTSEIIKNGKKTYQCDNCKLYFEDKEWADKCQAWCDEHHTCNVEITKHRIR